VENRNGKERPMLKREKLKSLLRKITDEQFDSVWRSTYGYISSGQRCDLVKEFVAEQYDGELDGCIQRVQSLLNPAATPRPKTKRLAARASTPTYRSHRVGIH
jgi:hypothetical protein